MNDSFRQGMFDVLDYLLALQHEGVRPRGLSSAAAGTLLAHPESKNSKANERSLRSS
jgi:hypothetical protein